MTDHTANGMGHAAGPRPVRVPRAEFRLYFVAIFLLALPIGVATWTWALVRHRRLPKLGPFARAFYDARAITPMIFAP